MVKRMMTTTSMVTVTPSIQAERGLQSGAGGLILAISDEVSAATGLHQGDVILRIGEWKISRLSDVIEVLRTLTPEVPVEVEVLRGLEVLTVEVVPETVKAGADP